MDQKLKEKLSSKSKWVRFAYMVIFLIAIGIIKLIVVFSVAVQFVMVLFTDKPNHMILEFSDSLSVYTADIIRFLSYNKEEKPFPFAPWPGHAAKPLNHRQKETSGTKIKKQLHKKK